MMISSRLLLAWVPWTISPIDILGKGLVLATVAWIAVCLLRNPNARLPWVAVTSLLLLLTVVTSPIAQQHGWHPWVGQPTVAANVDDNGVAPDTGMLDPADFTTNSAKSSSTKSTSGGKSPRRVATAKARQDDSIWGLSLRIAPSLLLTTWLVGIGVCLLRPLTGLARLFHLSRRPSVYSADSDWYALLESCKQDLQVSTPVRLLLTTDLQAPATWGVLRPVIGLPADANEWDVACRRMTLLHELEHVRHYDWLWQMISQIATAIHWPNLFAWKLTSRLQLDQDERCDRQVLQQGVSPTDYAQTLLDFGQRWRDKQGSQQSAVAIGMATPSTLARRVTQLISSPPPLPPRSMASRILVPVVCGLLWLGTSLTWIGATPPSQPPENNRQRQPSAATSTTAQPNKRGGKAQALPKPPTILSKLQRPFKATLKDVPLANFTRKLSQANQIPIIIDQRSLEEVGLTPDLPINYVAGTLPLWQVLDAALKPYRLGWSLRNETIVITTQVVAEQRNLINWVYHVTGDHDLAIKRLVTRIAAESWDEVGGPAAVATLSKKTVVVAQTISNHLALQQQLKNTYRLVPGVAAEPPGLKLPATLKKRVSLNYQRQTLAKVVQQLNRKYQLRLQLDRRALDEIGLTVDIPVTIALEKVTLRSAISLALQPLDLVMMPQPNGQIAITTPAVAQRKLLKLDYRFNELDPRAVQVVLTTIIEPDDWEEVGGNGSVKRQANGLIISQNYHTHQQIARLLATLQAAEAIKVAKP